MFILNRYVLLLGMGSCLQLVYIYKAGLANSRSFQSCLFLLGINF